eukprot:TRINITY_DN66258_c2_g2_i2.p1 TRINITY_DN66258_c2_g2~~TRINITY_DN66258_c2_g2_i2.p1  ORF type:complete len:607 (+),score=54.89 TRINITY_DN66258_c2_g2_i2:586-2406(+)
MMSSNPEVATKLEEFRSALTKKFKLKKFKTKGAALADDFDEETTFAEVKAAIDDKQNTIITALVKWNKDTDPSSIIAFVRATFEEMFPSGHSEEPDAKFNGKEDEGQGDRGPTQNQKGTKFRPYTTPSKLTSTQAKALYANKKIIELHPWFHPKLRELNKEWQNLNAPNDKIYTLAASAIHDAMMKDNIPDNWSKANCIREGWQTAIVARWIDRALTRDEELADNPESAFMTLHQLPTYDGKQPDFSITNCTNTFPIETLVFSEGKQDESSHTPIQTEAQAFSYLAASDCSHFSATAHYVPLATLVGNRSQCFSLTVYFPGDEQWWAVKLVEFSVKNNQEQIAKLLVFLKDHVLPFLQTSDQATKPDKDVYYDRPVWLNTVKNEIKCFGPGGMGCTTLRCGNFGYKLLGHVPGEFGSLVKELLADRQAEYDPETHILKYSWLPQAAGNNFKWDHVHCLLSQLECIHNHGLVHGDVWGGNIVWTDDGAKLIDWELLSLIDAKYPQGYSRDMAFPRHGNAKTGQLMKPDHDIFAVGQYLRSSFTITGKDKLKFQTLLDSMTNKQSTYKFQKERSLRVKLTLKKRYRCDQDEGEPMTTLAAVQSPRKKK